MEQDVLPRRFRLIGRLGDGGSARVLHVADRALGREIALKVVPRDESALARDEFRALSRLAHPNLPRVEDLVTLPDGSLGIALELVQGRRLDRWLDERFPDLAARARAPEVLLVLDQLLAALDALHDRGLVHRDLKPANVLIADEKEIRVVLIDLGLSRPRDATSDLGGTAEYASPERIQGRAEDARGDLYALGAVLFELLSGAPPFSRATAAETFDAHLVAPPPLDRISPEWRPLLASLLAKEPEKRPASAEAVWRALPRDTPTTPRFRPALGAPFVGRAREIRRLETLLDATRRVREDDARDATTTSVRDRSPRVLLVEAGRGNGATRLLRETSVLGRLAGDTIVLEGARAGDGPGALLRRITDRLDAELSGARGLTDSLDGIVEDLQRELGRSHPDDAAIDAFGERTASLLVERAQASPYTLLIDDFHLADSSSRRVVNDLARRARGLPRACLSLVVSSRVETDEDRALLDALSRSSEPDLTETLPLAPLPSAAVADWIASLLGTRDEPEGIDASGRDSAESSREEVLVAELATSTGGNPYRIAEHLELLRERGAFERRGARWRLRRIDRLPVPASVEDAASRRIESLRPEIRVVVETLAVAGHSLSAPALSRVLDCPLPTLSTTLARAALAGLVVVDATGARISHAALADAAVRTIEEERLRTIHLRIAHELITAEGELTSAREEGERAELDGDATARIGHHLARSSEPHRSFPYLTHAGERALRHGALREARASLDSALAVAKDDDARASCFLLLERTTRLLGDREAQSGILAGLRELATRAKDRALHLEIELRFALYLDAVGKKREAHEVLDRALASSDSRGPLEGRLLSRRGMMSLFLGEFDDSRESLESALEIAASHEDTELRAECLQLLGIGAYFQGRYDEAIRDLERALALRRALDDSHRASALESNLGLIHLDRGQLEAARLSFEECLKTDRRAGHRRGEATHLLNLGLVHTEAGRLERALDFLGEALEARRSQGDRRAEGVVLGNLARVWLAIGHAERGTQLLETALELSREHSNPQSECVLECRRARALLDAGDSDGAAAAVEHATAALARAPGRVQSLLVRTTHAAVQLAGEHPSSARDDIEASLEIARAAGMRGWIAECASLRASLHLALGDLDEAEKDSALAVATLDELDGRQLRAPEIWLVRHRVLAALHRRGDGGVEEPERALRRAYTLLREIVDGFDDPESRRACLENVPTHREIDRLHDELQLRRRQEATARERSYYEIARTIHSILELEELLDRLLELAIETTRGEKGLILLRGSDGELTTRAARGMPSESVADAREICESVIDDVARGGKPVLATDAASDERFRDRQSVISFQIRTLLCVPMGVRDEVIGAVYVDGRGASSFSTDDLDFLVSFAHLAANAVDNTRLLERLRAENQALRREVDTRTRLDHLVCESPRMRQVARLAEKVAASTASVLITGETGTGKTVLARAIHRASPRAARPFVTVDCGALPESLLESELFGHRRGSFSGALHDRTGLVEEADGGTLFLDEITNTTLELQAKLLRVIQEGEIRRLGENRVQKVDVRIVAATNDSLEDAVAEGRFRQDLYYRLHVVPIEIPPLRERREDIAPLALRFLEKSRTRMGNGVTGFTEDAMRVLESSTWKGNVRELENTIEKAVVLADNERLDGAFLASLIDAASRTSLRSEPIATPAPLSDSRTLDDTTADPETLAEFDARWSDAERSYLLELVDATGWNLSAAARLAGVRNRNTLVSRLKKHGLTRPGS